MAITDDDEAWRKAFTAAVADVGDRMSYQQAAERLHGIVRTGLDGHRRAPASPGSRRASTLGSSFGSLCITTCSLASSSPWAHAQIAEMITRNREHPRLGCFGLSELLTGVNSGLIVQTAAEFDQATSQLIINMPNPGATKN
ncbi:Acyl-CoA oxidase/dehydrogenase middle domain-containing protein [Plasmodiophora brassicae]